MTTTKMSAEEARRASLAATEKSMLDLGEIRARAHIKEEQSSQKILQWKEMIDSFPLDESSQEETFQQLFIGSTHRQLSRDHKKILHNLLKSYWNYLQHMETQHATFQKENMDLQDDLNISNDQGTDYIKQIECLEDNQLRQNEDWGKRVVKLHTKCRERNQTIRRLKITLFNMSVCFLLYLFFGLAPFRLMYASILFTVGKIFWIFQTGFRGYFWLTNSISNKFINWNIIGYLFLGVGMSQLWEMKWFQTNFPYLVRNRKLTTSHTLSRCTNAKTE